MLGEMMRAELERRPLRADLVVPVPLAPGRSRQRGYNQAELLAREILASMAAELAPTLLRRASRPPQHTLSAAERAENMVGAVACADETAVQGLSVVLIDDVCTTGATLSACAEALMDAGATRVSAFVFARDL
jgi:ComF family protein